MKKILTNLLFILTFILCFASNVFAAEDLNINSVTFDNSSSIVSINTFDNEDYVFAAQPKLYILEEEQKVYFDINSSVLKCPSQDLVVNSPYVKEVIVKQFSTNPNIVRVVIYYKDGFNPKNIHLKKLNNSLYVQFAQMKMQNFYFHQVYTDVISSVNQLYESIMIQTPVLAQSSVVDQINSAFKLGSTTEDQNYILTKKDLTLPTKYYIDNINIKNSGIHVTGTGLATVTKSFSLSNPARIVFDIPNAVVNTAIRNKEFPVSQNESIKIGQFNKDTARVVITSPNCANFLPVIYSDAQRLVFVNKANPNYNQLYSVKSALNSIYDEINDTKTHSVKLIFTKPVIYGIDRTNSMFDLYLYNIENSQNFNLKSSLMFEGAKLTDLKGGGVKISIPLAKEDELNIHSGIDGKTLRLKIKCERKEIIKADEPVIKPQPAVPVKKDNKKVIVIDPGHGGSDHGAIRNNISEKNITLDISQRVTSLLEKKGYVVYMTRETDATVSLQDRVEISEDICPEIFVSIHVNSSNSESPNGIETHYYKDNSLDLAKTVHASMLNHVSANNRGLFKSKFYVINHTTAPAILVEIGFLSNPSERAQLVSESRKQATAKAIAEGIDDYFK